jgi:ankyrin repeat protein
MEVCFKGYMQGQKDRAINTRYTIVKELLANGADPNTYKFETQMSPLHWAAFNKDPKTCQVLLNKGADAERMNVQDQYPIDVAGYTPSLTCVDVFL